MFGFSLPAVGASLLDIDIKTYVPLIIIIFILMLVFLLWNTSPIASHLIGRLECETNEGLDREVVSWKR